MSLLSKELSWVHHRLEIDYLLANNSVEKAQV